MSQRRAWPIISRPPSEARSGIVAIILISSLAFLVFQARKDMLGTLAIHEARLAVQFASIAKSGTIGDARVIDAPELTSGDFAAGLPALPGQTTVVSPLRPGLGNNPAPMPPGVEAMPEDDTHGKFVIRGGRLFASMRDDAIAVRTSAPLSAVFAGLWSRIAIDIFCVFFLGSLLLLVRESRLSDYSVRRLLDASPVPLFLIDAEGRADFANRPALDLFTASPQSANGFQDGLRRHEQLFEWLIGSADWGEQIETREFEVDSPSHAPRHLLVSRQSLVVRSRRMIIASVADITVRHEAETALMRAKNAAEALGRMKSESLAMISHELRTPVNGVLGLAQLLAKQQLGDPANRIVRRMVQAGKTLAVIINDIVDLAMLEIGHLRLDPRPFDPKETITTAVTLASAAASGKGLAVRVSTFTPLPPLVFGDPARLQQIVINLVGNGIKFTEAGSIEVRTDVARRDEDRIELLIEVVDTGIGIPPDVLPRLFQPFSQAEVGHKRRYEGTGLGLAISKSLADAMGGSISVRSEIGRGSTFSVRLPFSLKAMAEEPDSEPPPSRVLVVDDVALNRDIVADLLRSEGCEVDAVGSGEEAIEALKVEAYDLVLMDIRMPGMDGLTATTAIRSSEGPIRHSGRILGLTANPLPTDRPLYLLRGIDGIIEKPVESDRLRAALRHPANGGERDRLPQPQRIARLQETLGVERALRIVAAYIEVADAAVEAIADGCARLDFAGVGDNAHRLSGAASNVGFDELAEAAMQLEKDAETEGAVRVSEAALKVIVAHRLARRAAQTWLDTTAALDQAENR